MSLLKELTIENFRGFDKIELKEFSKINIVLGKNNSGKTSILEAIFLLAGMSNPILPDTINRFRGIASINASNLKYLFHNISFVNNPTFTAILDDSSERTLELSPLYKGSSEKEKVELDGTSSSAMTTYSPINGLDLNFSTKKKQQQRQPYKASINYTQQGLSRIINNKYIEKISATFIGTESNDSTILAGYSELVKKKKDDFVLHALQTFDKRIESIQPLPDGIYLGLKNIDELVLSNMAGDGIRRFLKIITAVANPSRTIILIDEIENGLHYSAYRLLWESILALSSTLDSQLFITTHNVETLKCLQKVLEDTENEIQREYVKVFTVVETKNAGFKSYGYSYEGFKEAIDNEMEMRG